MKKTIITMFALGLIVSPSFALVTNDHSKDTTTTNYGDTNYDYSSTNNIDNTNYASNTSYNNADSTANSSSRSTSKSAADSNSSSSSNSSSTGGNSSSTNDSNNTSSGGNSSVTVRNTPSAPPAVAPTVIGQAGTNSVSGGVSTILGGVSGGVSITTKAAKKQIEATTTAIDIQNLKDLKDLDPDTAAKIKRSILRRYK